MSLQGPCAPGHCVGIIFLWRCTFEAKVGFALVILGPEEQSFLQEFSQSFLSRVLFTLKSNNHPKHSTIRSHYPFNLFHLSQVVNGGNRIFDLPSLFILLILKKFITLVNLG